MTSAAAATDFPPPGRAAAEPLFPVAAAPRRDAGFSLRDALQLLCKHGWLIGGCTVGVAVLVWAMLAVQPRAYEGAAKLWIKTEQQAMPSFLSGIAAYRDQAVPDPVNRKIETEMELLLSRDSAERVVEQLQLRPGQLRRAPLDVVAERLAPLRLALAGWLGRAPQPAAAADAVAQRQALVDAFLKSFTVEPQRSKGSDTTSNILEVRFAAADPALVPAAIQAMVQAYIQLAAQQNRRLGEATFALLESKAAEARRDLAGSEQALLAFMTAQGERTSRAAPRGGAGVEGADALPGGTSMVGLMKSQAADLQRRMDDLRQLYTEEAANVRALGQSIGALQQRIKREVRANAEADAQLSLLERQRALAQERFVELQRRLDQIDVYLKVNPTEAESRVMTQSPERPLRPETRRLWLAALLGPLGGLLLGLALAGLRELLDRRLQTPDELHRALGLEVLAALPALPQRVLSAQRYQACLAGAQRRLGRAAAGSRPADAGVDGTRAGHAGVDDVTLLREPRPTRRVPVVSARLASDRSLLLHRLALRVREQLPPAALGRVLVVTSARPGEGKSVIARALAKRLAVQGRGGVLLVDANPVASAGHGGARALGRPGFFDILRDREVMAEVVASRDTPRLQSLGTGFDAEAALLYHDAAVAELVAKVRERYDWTVIDAGCLHDLGGLVAHADAALLVVDAQRTRREVVQGALAAAHLPPRRLVGAVLNRRPQYVPGWLYRGLLG